ncbi:MAG: hypothetical protein IKQ41_10570 [Clostridia bacterium]|nr:hypothetical protein [Clostridia bacterium]
MKGKVLFVLVATAFLTLMCASALAEKPTAAIFFTNEDGTQAYWGYDSDVSKGTTAVITGEGRYKVSVEFTAPIKEIQFCFIAIQNAEKKWPSSVIEVHTIRIDGKYYTFSKSFTYSGDEKTTVSSLWDKWYTGGVNPNYNPRSIDGDLSDVSTLLTKNNLIGAKKIEVEFSFHEKSDDSKLVKRLQAKHMNTEWNAVAVIYTQVTDPKFPGKFTKKEVKELQDKVIKYFKPNVNGIAKGRMTIGSVETFVIDEPITKVASNGCPTYGIGGSADFYSLIKGKDVNLVMVFVPVRCPEWLGLGGGYVMYGNQKVYITTICDNTYAMGDGIWKHDGVSCHQACSALIHEFIHCLETNSRENGWTGFQELHSWPDNGYVSNDTYGFDWYFDLMRDTIKNGRFGFHPASYYVTHYGVK